MLCVGTRYYIKRLFAERNANIRYINNQCGLSCDEKQIQILQAKANCLDSVETVLKKEFCVNELEDL